MKADHADMYEAINGSDVINECIEIEKVLSGYGVVG